MTEGCTAYHLTNLSFPFAEDELSSPERTDVDSSQPACSLKSPALSDDQCPISPMIGRGRKRKQTNTHGKFLSFSITTHTHTHTHTHRVVVIRY